MRGKAILLALAIAFATVSLMAQVPVRTPIPADMYCSGLVTRQAPPSDTVLITGEGSDIKLTFQEGDYVYINKGEGQGVHVGDEFSVIRPVDDPTRTPWFNQEFSIMHAIGTLWEDEGRVKVVVVHPNTSVAQIENSCEYLQRGDVALPFAQRPAPQLKPEDKFDRFARAQRQSQSHGRLRQTFPADLWLRRRGLREPRQRAGRESGRLFPRLPLYRAAKRIRLSDAAHGFRVFGFGAVSKNYKWDNVPREVLGEGIVVRTSENASSVIITFALREVYAGDYVELE